jgi:multiple antibiotic resistance protein
LFIFFGRALLNLLGVTIADFMIAGGLLLFAISVSDLLSVEKRQRRVDPESVGAVPIGVPLITGPAVLTSSIILLDKYGAYPTTLALITNIIIVGSVFWISAFLYGILGNAGSKAISKLASLLLAAISIMIIRRGIASFLK